MMDDGVYDRLENHRVPKHPSLNTLDNLLQIVGDVIRTVLHLGNCKRNFFHCFPEDEYILRTDFLFYFYVRPIQSLLFIIFTPIMRPPFIENFIFPVPDASVPAREICSLKSAAGITFSAYFSMHILLLLPKRHCNQV
jgi:hypothetical protein